MMNNENKMPNYNEAREILDKMIELEKSEKKMSFGKKCFFVTACVAAIVILIALCVMLDKKSFSLESLISVLLAFFSIFISVFFYFKADEASNRFYETSYDFMKDVSVTLGKIEERFGEKLNSLNDKVSHLSEAKEEKREELESAEDEKQSIIDDLIKKAKLTQHEQEEYRNRLKNKEQEIFALQRELIRMRNFEKLYDDAPVKSQFSEYYQKIRSSLTPRDVKIIRSSHISDWPKSLKEKLHALDIIDLDGEFTPRGEEFFSQMMHQNIY